MMIMVIMFRTANKVLEVDVCKVKRIYHNGDEIVVSLRDGKEYSTFSIEFYSVWG